MFRAHRWIWPALLAGMGIAALSNSVGAQDPVLPLPEDQPVRAAHYPALSPDARTLCFSYLGDLWTVPSVGGVATRLTVHEAHDGYPRWSPDGKWIAFSSNRHGPSYDLYIVPAHGGEPRQLTFSSDTDILNDWSPDGKSLLFYSPRGMRGFEVCSLDLATGAARRLTRLNESLRFACFTPDGQAVAYTRMSGTIPYWRPRYRGSGNADIYLLSLADKKTIQLTDYEGMDMWPLAGKDRGTLFYVTDALDGAPNLVRLSVEGLKKQAVTRHKEDAVRFPTIARNGSLLCYEWNGGLWTVKPDGSDDRELKIICRTESKTNLIQRLTLTNGVGEMQAAPNGKQLALGLRGEIWSVSVDKGGEATRLTDHPAQDYDFAWSPDGSRLAFVTDREGPYRVHILDPTTRELTHLGQDAYDDTSPQWSPDGKTLAFLRSGPEGGLYTQPVGGGAATRVAESRGNNMFGVGINSYAWSPDGKWLAFSRRDELDTRDIWVVPAAGGSATNITRYPGINMLPIWSPDGKQLLFISDRDSSSRQLMAVSLEKPKEEEMAPAPPSTPSGPVEVRIDFDEIHLRARTLTEIDGEFAITPDSKSALLRRANDLWSASISGGGVTRLTTTGDVGDGPYIPSSGGHAFYLAGGVPRSIPLAGGAPATINFTARMELDRRAELAEAFNQFWRHLNSAFYDPKMHGVDWRALRTKYQSLLPHLSAREDFASLLMVMVGELNASHSEVTSAGSTGGLSTGKLGVDFDEDYVGPGLRVSSVLERGPCDKDGSRIKPGEFVLAIDGMDVKFDEQFPRTLADKTGRSVELLVNGEARKDGARIVKVKPVTVSVIADLEYERKVRQARAQVEKLSDGKFAYIHVRGMNQPSLRRFQRELFGEAQLKQGLVLDVRDNGGGNTHDDLLGPLSRTVYGYTQPRDGARSTQPVRHWSRPIVLLINEGSASDAEIFPYGFRSLKLGKIVGRPTPGYVIGTYGGQLIDGTGYRIPMWGWFTADGKNMENNGVRPDIEVVNDPDSVRAGKDPQLEVAVRTLLDQSASR